MEEFPTEVRAPRAQPSEEIPRQRTRVLQPATILDGLPPGYLSGRVSFAPFCASTQTSFHSRQQGDNNGYFKPTRLGYDLGCPHRISAVRNPSVQSSAQWSSPLLLQGSKATREGRTADPPGVRGAQGTTAALTPTWFEGAFTQVRHTATEMTL